MGFKIGNVKINGNLVLGPMAGVTDLPFRILCKEQGADLIYTEMVSAKGIMYDNKNTIPLLRVEEIERPVSIQLFGSDPYLLSEMAKKIEDRNFDILDINMGCPVPKVVNNNEGSALMKNPKLVGQIVNELAKAIRKPVTVKIRKGFSDDEINAVEIAKIAQENGASAVAIHPRTRGQYYSGEADWDIIRQVKEALSIPVIGSGDVVDGKSAKKMLDNTGCDGIMIARAARGNPWIFRDIKAYINQEESFKSPDIRQLTETMIRHARMQLEFKGEYTGIREMRKHVSWYTNGYPNSAKLRVQINEIETFQDLEALILQWREQVLKQPCQ